MKTIRNILLGAGVVFLLLYIPFSIAGGSANPFSWDECTRFYFAAFFSFLTAISSFVIAGVSYNSNY